MTSNLVRKQITDKNGVTSSRWVKPDNGPSKGPRIPLPSSTPAPRAEAKQLDAEIRDAVEQAEEAGSIWRWTAEDKTHLHILRETNDVDTLRVIHRLVTNDVGCSPDVVGNITRELKRRGYEHPSEMMHDDALSARSDIIRALRIYGESVGHPFYSQKHEAQDVWLMAFTDFDYAQRIASIVEERGILPEEEIRSLLAEMDKVGAPLAIGVL